jgi:tripartite-type tricarboxylate transporter receptor subunit TctC
MSFAMNRVGALAAACIVSAAGSSVADPVADFYKGRTVAMLVASGPGGGYDLYARTLVRHYPRHIPGNPNIVIQYVPGGGGIVAANTLYSVTPRDGTGMGLLASSTFLLAAVGDKNTKFDNLKFTFIGNMNEEVDTCSVWHTTGIKSADDLKTREVIIGTAGPGSNSQTFPLGMNSVLGMKFKSIPGYHGGAQIRTTAMERGELQGTCGIFVSTMNAQFPKQLADGHLKVILQMGLSRHPAYKDVPNALEMATDPNGRAALELLFAQLALGRPILGPPEIPAERAAALQKGFDATMDDPQFRTESQKTGVELRWFGAARMKEVMERMEAAPQPVKDDVRKLLNAH